jgi:hypothetical protein
VTMFMELRQGLRGPIERRCYRSLICRFVWKFGDATDSNICDALNNFCEENAGGIC